MKKLFVYLCMCAALVCAFVLTACSGTSALEDGSYDIQIETDSSMVNVVYGKLDIADGAMMCTMALHGQGFTRIYEGTTDAVETADQADIVDYVQDADGWYTFTFPVSKLDEQVDYSLFGVRRDRWYDHKLIIHSPGFEQAQ